MAKAKKNEKKGLDLAGAAGAVRLPPRRHGGEAQQQAQPATEGEGDSAVRYNGNAQVYLSSALAGPLKVYCAKNNLRMKAVLDKIVGAFLEENGIV